VCDFFGVADGFAGFGLAWPLSLFDLLSGWVCSVVALAAVIVLFCVLIIQRLFMFMRLYSLNLFNFP
jgi:hypothetical protein